MKRLILTITLLSACQEMEKLPPVEQAPTGPRQPAEVFVLTAPQATTYLARLAPNGSLASPDMSVKSSPALRKIPPPPCAP